MRPQTSMHLTRKLAALAAVGLAAAPPTHAQGYTLRTLASFTGGNSQRPAAGLTLSGGALYGTALGDNTNTGGSVFSLPVGGGPVTTLTTFNGGNGSAPAAGLTLSGGTLYGTTEYGGPSQPPIPGGPGTANPPRLGNGTVFSLPVGGGPVTTLTAFNGVNGANPIGGLTLRGGALYGTTFNGGTSGVGTAFSVLVAGGPPTVLAGFDQQGASGGNPSAGLTLSADGTTLYGSTTYGGPSAASNGLGDGAIFSVPTNGGPVAALATFSGGNGTNPGGDLMLVGGTLYGTTEQGGAANQGTLFSVSAGGGAITTLANFNGLGNGQAPTGRLVLIGGTLYGTTLYGGVNNQGTVFSVPVGGGAITTLFTFNGSNGAYPSSGLMLGADGTLYGTTQGGGASYTGVLGGYGTVFSLTPSAAPEPSSVAALGLGVLGLGALKLTARRRRAA